MAITKSEAIKRVTEMSMVYNGIKKEKFDEKFSVLFIVEGHSPASTIRSNRDSSCVGVLALRGKILNCWQKSLKNALKSDIVGELIRVLDSDAYDLIILTADSDADGKSINTLLLAPLVRYRKHLLQDGKIRVNATPFYTFYDKKNKLIGWSNSAHDCPDGANIEPNKGLGSYDDEGVKRLILNPSAGAEWVKIEMDRGTDRSLTMALVSGGKELVYKDDANNEPKPYC